MNEPKACIVAVNEMDALDFSYRYPTIGDLPWLTPSQYMRMGERAPRMAYVTEEVKQLESYQVFRAMCLDNFGIGDQSWQDDRGRR